MDGCITKAPWASEVAGPSPVDRRKQGLKRSVATDAGSIPLATLPAPANHRGDGLLAPTLDAIGVVGSLPQRLTVHLDAGYDWQPCRQVLATRGMVGEIASRGQPTPIQVDHRRVIERTHAWGNQDGKLRWCTKRRRPVVEFWLRLSAPSSSVVDCSAEPGSTTAGKLAPAAHDRLLAQALRQSSRMTLAGILFWLVSATMLLPPRSALCWPGSRNRANACWR